MDEMNGFRKCSHEGCESPATHYYVWTEPQYACMIHLNAALTVAEAMGFPTPQRTARRLTIDEMIVDEAAESEGGDGE